MSFEQLAIALHVLARVISPMSSNRAASTHTVPSCRCLLPPLQELSESELVQVLTEPRNALCKQYSSLLGMSGAQLRVTRAALRAIARQALRKGTGTRGLRCIMEKLLMDAMFQVRGP